MAEKHVVVLGAGFAGLNAVRVMHYRHEFPALESQVKQAGERVNA